MSQKDGGKEGSHNKVYTAKYKRGSVNLCKSKLDCLGMLMWKINSQRKRQTLCERSNVITGI